MINRIERVINRTRTGIPTEDLNLTHLTKGITIVEISKMTTIANLNHLTIGNKVQVILVIEVQKKEVSDHQEGKTLQLL